MAISKETQVGVLAALAITVLIIGYNFLRGDNVFESTNRYYGKYDKIEGLFASNPVIINGYKVGHVSSVELDNSSLELTVGIKVPEGIKVPKNSIMKIVNNDMIGSKAVEIIFGNSKEYAKDGDVLQAMQDQGIAQAVSGVLTPLTKSVSSVLGNIDTAIAGADLETTLKDASLALKAFKETADKLNRLLDGKGDQIEGILNSLAKTTKGFEGISPKIDGILSEIDATSKDLAAVEFEQLANQIKALSSELQQTTSALNNSEGTLGLLLNEKEVHDNLNSTIKNLNSLVQDIEKYPKRYFSLTAKGSKKATEEKEEAEASN